jgi:hypothetical protein
MTKALSGLQFTEEGFKTDPYSDALSSQQRSFRVQTDWGYRQRMSEDFRSHEKVFRLGVPAKVELEDKNARNSVRLVWW